MNPLGAAAAGLCLLLPFVSGLAMAGTTGRISGQVLDGNKAPLAGVNVAVPQARTGAVTDVDGRYVIINVPSGTYDVRVSLLGYQATLVQGVVVSADNTARLDATLTIAPVGMKEVVVNAQRPVVDLSRTSTMATLDREQIKHLPVQELQEVVNLQAGVVDGHFRGGRRGEVQYQVDGVTVNNVYDNASTLKLDRSLLEEVQVISGTFDAEYGQAMSGVVNAVLRRGSDRFRWDGEVLDGGFFYPAGGFPFPRANQRIQSFKLDPGSTQNYQFSVSGPTSIPKTTYLVSTRYYRFDDWVNGTLLFRPTDRADFQDGVFKPTALNYRVPLGYSRERSGLVKLTNRMLPHTEINYQAVLNRIDGRRADYAWRLNPDGISKQHTASYTQGFDVTQTFSAKAYSTLSVRQNRFDYRDRLYDHLDDRRYDAGGIAASSDNYENGAIVQGVQQTRFRQTTNALVTKLSWVDQISRDQQLKAGAEFQWPVMRFGANGYLVSQVVNGTLQIVRIISAPPTFPGVLEYRPRLGAAFVQNDGEWNDLRVRSGLRFEYFDPNASLPGNLRNPANALPPPAPQSTPRPATRKISLSPRVGVSYPVAQGAALFFAYGHFLQLPALGTAYNDADYRVLATLQAGTAGYRIMGNPDVRPEHTVQYQFGYKQAITDWLGLELSMFYKDIRDLLGVEFIDTYNAASYARLTNVDFGNVTGFTLALDQRAIGRLSSSLDYTWQTAQGNSSDPNETAVRAQAGEDPRPRQVPLNWDQRHTLNLTLVMAEPDRYNASAIIRVASGQPYTPTVGTGFSGGLETNSGRKPASLSIDLRGEWQVRLADAPASLFGRVFNVTDARFLNGFVFGSTGSPYYSRDTAADRNQLADPTRFAGPRRVELGVTLHGGDSR